MRRRLCDRPAVVRVHEGALASFRCEDRDYEVTALLKMIALIRAEDDVDTRLYQVKARTENTAEATYELECDHGAWRLVALWE